MSLEKMLVMFKESLYNAWYEWLKHHQEILGKAYPKLLKETKKGWKNCNTAIHLVAHALWIFNMIANYGGVMAGLGPCSVNIHSIPAQLDEKLTKKVLLMCSSCLALQSLPKDVAREPLPARLARAPWRFKLADYIAAQSSFLG